MKQGKGKYFIVQNLTSSPQVVNPARRALIAEGGDLVIQPYHYAEVESPELWEDDRNLQTAIALGRVRAFWADERPRGFPKPPQAMQALGDPRLQGMVTEMVMGRDDLARDFILAEPRFEMRAGQPIDRDWMKNTGWTVLNLAREWLLAWGPPPDKQWRVDLINDRLEFIRALP